MDTLNPRSFRKRVGSFAAWILRSLSARLLRPTDTTPPVIDVWYGNHQVFGHRGLSQKWINILGRAVDPESGVKRLTYRLNDAPPLTLKLGEDGRRLMETGDFNIEFAPGELNEGPNHLLLEAENRAGLTAQAQVTIELQYGACPLPCEIRWGEVSSLMDVVQVVDGQWTWDADGVRPVKAGYDRLLSLGDYHWTDYEVVVPVTIHRVDLGGSVRDGAGVGLYLHWWGHSDEPKKCDAEAEPRQPHCGWRPYGASAWYSFKRFNKGMLAPDYLAIFAEPSDTPREHSMTTKVEFKLNCTYIYKARVETIPTGLVYRLKVWEQEAHAEPADWLIERTTTISNPPHGGILLAANYVDATFGDITVTPL